MNKATVTEEEALIGLLAKRYLASLARSKQLLGGEGNGELASHLQDSDAAAVDGLDRAYGDHDLFTGAASHPASLGLEAAVRDALMASKAEELKNEGNSLMQDGRHEEAIQSYSAAIELSPKPRYLGNRAAALAAAGQLDEAIADCRRALGIDPAYAKAYSRLGLAHKAKGEMSLAREAFAQAVRLDPQDVNSQEQLCLLGGSEAAGDSESAVGGDPTALALRGGDVAGAIGSMFSDPGAFSTMASTMLNSPGFADALQAVAPIMEQMVRPTESGGLDFSGMFQATASFAQQGRPAGHGVPDAEVVEEEDLYADGPASTDPAVP